MGSAELLCRIWKTIGKEFVYYFIALQFIFSFLEAQVDFAEWTHHSLSFHFDYTVGGVLKKT